MDNEWLLQYAKTCADAYVNMYIDPDGHKVMNQPCVVYNPESGRFAWQSTLTPLGDDLLVETLEQGMYGEESDDPEIQRNAIIAYLMETITVEELQQKLEPSFDL